MRSRTGIAFSRASLAALGLVALLLAANASAGVDSVEIASDAYAPGNPSLNLSTPVECPEGSIAVGGGTAVTDLFFLGAVRSGPTFDGYSLFNQPEGIGPAPTGWAGAALLSDIYTTPRVRVGAVCATGMNVQSVVTETPLDIGAVATTTATCPEGSAAISAGFFGSGAAVGSILAFEPTFEGTSLTEILPGSSGPAPVGWTVTTRNDGIFSGTLKLAVLCLSGRPVTTRVSETGISFQSVGSAGVACAENEVATGGAHSKPGSTTLGWIGSGPMVGGIGLAELADGSAAAPDGWMTALRNTSTFVIAPIAAICVPEPSAAAASLGALAALGRIAGRRRHPTAR